MTQYRTATGWVGWIWFGSLMMIMVGFFNVMNGLIAIFKDEFYVQTRNSLFLFDVTGWGWVHLILGLIAIAAGFGLLRGAAWAQVVAIVILMVNGLTQLAIVNLNPWWSFIVIGLDILVLYAIVVHGDERVT